MSAPRPRTRSSASRSTSPPSSARWTRHSSDGPSSHLLRRGLASLMADRVRIYEVGPRDGLQNESTAIPLATKVEFVRRLAAAGLREIEATSFVSPKAIPQLADADALLPAVMSATGGTAGV